MTRFVVRPPSITRTPRLLAERLDATTRRSDYGHTRFDPVRDIFLSYPNPSRLSIYTESKQVSIFRDLYSFANANKASQRIRLQSAGVPTPSTATTHAAATEFATSHPGRSNSKRVAGMVTNSDEPRRFIVRAYRHQGGSSYRLTNDPTDFIEGQEYVQAVYPKDREYRVIYCKGDPLVTLVKRKPEGATAEQAWNHQQGASFVTVNNEKNDRLLRTDFYEKMAKVPIITHGHIIAADVLWSDKLGYVVCELNTCPGLTIPGNLERIVNHVQGHH